jgi:SAM-dependent methyltransferase
MMSKKEFAPALEELFETIACPLCGSGDFDVRRRAEYSPGIGAEQLRSMFSASSDHMLLDQVVRCRSCSLVYVNPRIRPDVILSGYAGAEDSQFTDQNEARIKAFRATLKKVIRRLGLDPRGKRLLDIGCAGGAFLVAARDCGFEVTGVEPSRWMAAFAKKTYGLDVREGILEPGMFAEQSFDVITLWDVIEHLPQPHETLTLAARLLKPDGFLLVNYPDIASVAARLLGERWPFWLSVHLLYYTPKTIYAQLRRAGFSPSWHESFWPTLPLGYIAKRAAPYSPLLAVLPRLTTALGLNAVHTPYNAGQTLVVSRAASQRKDS